jgi:hypothetical protein
MAQTYHYFNPLIAELNPICHLLALLGAHPILHVSRVRVKNPFPWNGDGYSYVGVKFKISVSVEIGF